jgi:hypothetical protein
LGSPSRDVVVVVSVLWVSPQEILDLKVLIPAAAGATAWNQESAGRKILIPVVSVRKAVNWVVSVLRVSHRAVFALRALFPEGLNQQALVRLVGRSPVWGGRILIRKSVCLGVCSPRAAGPPAWDAGPARGRRLLLPE